MDRILRLPEVLAVYPIGRSTWYRGISEGRFPRPVKLGSRSVGWRESDICRLME
ncbi:helix-turn-helix transcriptional regulator [Gloeomargarita lithophora]